MNVVKTPQSVNAQNGDKGGGTGRISRGVRAGGSNQGKLHVSGNRRYPSHPRKQGQ